MNRYSLLMIIGVFVTGATLCQIGQLTTRYGLSPNWQSVLCTGGIFLLTPCLTIAAIMLERRRLRQESRLSATLSLPGAMISLYCSGEPGYFSAELVTIMALAAIIILGAQYMINDDPEAADCD